MPCRCVPAIFVSIYRTPTSKEGQLVKDYFNRKGLAHDDFDVSSDTLALKKMESLSGQTERPVIVVDEHVFTGFDSEQLDLVVPSLHDWS